MTSERPHPVVFILVFTPVLLAYILFALWALFVAFLPVEGMPSPDLPLIILAVALLIFPWAVILAAWQLVCRFPGRFAAAAVIYAALLALIGLLAALTGVAVGGASMAAVEGAVTRRDLWAQTLAALPVLFLPLQLCLIPWSAGAAFLVRR